MTKPSHHSLPDAEQKLSGLALGLYGLLLLVLPLFNLVIGLILYAGWRDRQPRKAAQITRLVFLSFGLQVLIPALGGLGYVVSGFAASPPPSAGQPAPTAAQNPTPTPPPQGSTETDVTRWPGLLAYWSFDEGTGTEVSDASGHNLTATLQGDVTWIEGVRGKAVQFDGRTGFCDLGQSPALNFAAGAAFAVAGWVRTTEAEGTILSLRHSQDGSADLDVTLEGGRIALTVREDRSQFGMPGQVTGPFINDDRWHHFLVCRSEKARGDVTLFVDGVIRARVQSETTAGSLTTDLRALGCERYWVQSNFMSDDRRYLHGAVDEVCIFNRELSPQEIAQLASREAQR